MCVREDHRYRPSNDPAAAIVVLDLAPEADPAANEGRVLVCGADFYAHPRLSPDGRWLAWISWNHPDMPWDATRLEVAAFDEDGKLGPAITIAGGPDESVLQPEWSLDSVLHFISDRGGRWCVYRAGELSEMANAPAVTLAAAGDGEIGGPLWNLGARWYGLAPNGDIMAILAAGGQAMMVRADAAAQVIEVPGASQAFQCPVFLRSSRSASPSMAFISATPDSMQAVEIAEIDTGRVVRRERVCAAAPNALGPEDISIGTPFSFPTSGGQTVHAIWYPPTNAAFQAPDGERPPLVVMIHGGPTSSASNAFSLDVQWWTSRGFAVADVNYRGSVGFGRAYRQALDGMWGIADVEDCIAAARHLADRGMVDRNRMVIRGGSAGGFTTLAALVFHDVFRAGASLYGIGDLSLLAQETHKFEARYLDRLVGPWPQAADVYAARSPINHMEAMTAPVIFFQGLADKVVPPSQARVMVEAMSARGLPVAHYEFAGEAHGFRGAEALRRSRELELDFYGRVFGFEPPRLSERVALVGTRGTQPKA
ncbi:MAG: prolyl oligopeptidase family serine peptidase [Rhodopila sp.]